MLSMIQKKTVPRHLNDFCRFSLQADIKRNQTKKAILIDGCSLGCNVVAEFRSMRIIGTANSRLHQHYM